MPYVDPMKKTLLLLTLCGCTGMPLPGAGDGGEHDAGEDLSGCDAGVPAQRTCLPINTMCVTVGDGPEECNTDFVRGSRSLMRVNALRTDVNADLTGTPGQAWCRNPWFQFADARPASGSDLPAAVVLGEASIVVDGCYYSRMPHESGTVFRFDDEGEFDVTYEANIPDLGEAHDCQIDDTSRRCGDVFRDLQIRVRARVKLPAQ